MDVIWYITILTWTFLNIASRQIYSKDINIINYKAMNEKSMQQAFLSITAYLNTLQKSFSLNSRLSCRHVQDCVSTFMSLKQLNIFTDGPEEIFDWVYWELGYTAERGYKKI